MRQFNSPQKQKFSQFSPSWLLSPAPSVAQIPSNHTDQAIDRQKSGSPRNDQKNKISGISSLGPGLENLGGWDPANGKKSTKPPRGSISVLEPPRSTDEPIGLTFSQKKGVSGSPLDDDHLSVSYDSLPPSLYKAASFNNATLNSSINSHPLIRPSTALASQKHGPIKAYAIILNILSNWGDTTRC